MLRTPFGRLRWVALAEGISYIALLGLAMPIKYVLGFPGAVRLVGTLHGVLFVLLVVALLDAIRTQSITFRTGILVFMASLVPLGAFWMDKKLKDVSNESC